jgi:PAS domain S-box-containing protein
MPGFHMQMPPLSPPLAADALAPYELLPAGVSMVAPDGRFLAANAFYCRYVGYSLDELQRMRVADITHPDDRARDALALASLMAGEQGVYSVQKRYLRRDGELLWLSLSVRPVLDGRGRPAYALAVVQDIADLKRTERQLREHEARFRTIADAMPQMVWTTRPDGFNDYFNQQWYEFTGVAPGTTDGEAWSVVLHPDDRARAWAQWRHSLATGADYEIRYRLRHRSGEYRWVLGRALPVRDDAGRILRWMGTCTDIHAQKLAEDELRRSEAHLYAVFEQSAAGVAEADLDGHLLAVNDRFCAITGRTRDQLLGRRVLDFTHAEDLPASMAAIERLAHEAHVELDKRYVRPDGSAVWTNVAASRIHPQGGSPSMLTILFDISERKRFEEALRSADRKKDEFLAMLAHELRNPLAPIGAAAALLQMGRLDEQKTAHVSEVISRQVRHMTGLVNDLLDVSRVTRGIATLEMAPVDARTVVADAVDQVRPLIEARRHALHVQSCSAAVPLLGDPKRLVQVLVNLLNNAAKFTREGGRIALAMDVVDGHVQWTVSDNGIGMEPELVERAFELFAQAERTADRSQGGLGIGLALVKSLVELHQGTVSAQSAGPGQGSLFTVRLPLALQDREEAVPCDDAPAAQDRGLRLLVVDDNVDAATLLGMVLEDMGHEVMVEHDSARALQRAVLARPQVCLLDIGLPDIDGNELARRLRTQPETRDAVLIAVTGYGQERDREQSAAAGFDHHFMKPVDPAQLAAVLAEVEADVALG